WRSAADPGGAGGEHHDADIKLESFDAWSADYVYGGGDGQPVGCDAAWHCHIRGRHQRDRFRRADHGEGSAAGCADHEWAEQWAAPDHRRIRRGSVDSGGWQHFRSDRRGCAGAGNVVTHVEPESRIPGKQHYVYGNDYVEGHAT